MIEAIEAGAVDLELVGQRVQELRQERELVNSELESYQTSRPIPKMIHGPENVRTIQGSLKKLFLAPDSAVAKRYVRISLARLSLAEPMFASVATPPLSSTPSHKRTM